VPASYWLGSKSEGPATCGAFGGSPEMEHKADVRASFGGYGARGEASPERQ